ncbi:hypothetical protein JL720_5078 [Aureococcus anophagefferens]|nr:hypothetical protein JL720_5078 [Aureococcus anophagefferens]
MIGVDGSGSLDKAGKAVKTDQKVIKFLVNCGNQNLQYRGPEWEEAESALANKLEARAAKREAQAKAARKEIEGRVVSAARKCFEMIDKDNSGTLTKVEIVKAIAEDKDVVKFLKTCGEENLQFLLFPARLEGAPGARPSSDGELGVNEWEDAIQRGLAKRLDDLANERERRERAAQAEDEAFSVEFLSAARQAARVGGGYQSALANKLEARAAKREAQAKAARKEIEEFTSEFVSAARKCFEMIDKDNSGTLTKVEIVKAIAEDKDVVKFLKTCGEENLQFLLFPARLEKALQAEDEAFSVEFLSAARQVFDMIDVDQSGSLDKAEVVKAVKTDQKVIKFLVNCGNQNLQYLLVPARLEAALNVLDTDRDGEISGPVGGGYRSALANKLEARAAKREAQAKAARKEIEEFTSEFVSAARKCLK